MSHAVLSKCDDDGARWKIAASVEHIEYELRCPCRHFAYPYGDAAGAGPREFAIARDVGVETAATTRKGLIGGSARYQLWSLPRFSLTGDYQDERFFRVLLHGPPFKMLDLAQQALGRGTRPGLTPPGPAAASTR